ncbi:hypothetical protein GCM10011507_35150 [Edaphobacter acidisoli]|uniref:Replication terminator protein n=1 Tax=Edaphobacter acidisoli TaxID=2040573 RepID=A0A916S2J4_9BACT|nr:hypothetical protein [Edaphobacter acidisoli]GGA80899.1 hypothetical protein GCM10011507_35150 [Edaphobacter acidisoli]
MAKEDANPVVHDGLPELLSIDNMANGAVYEMFNEALNRLAANVADPNTEPTQKRKIVLTIEAAPYKDRSGAEYKATVDTKLAGLKPAEATMYFANRNGQHLAFGRNTKQQQIEFSDVSDEPAPKPKLN